MDPHTPKELSPYARATLAELDRRGWGHKISLGGALALSYYLEYRPTHDVDAWWDPSVTAVDRRGVVACLQEALSPFGQTRTRSWGDVVSVELMQQSQTVFSFQIARRGAQLQPSVPAPWPKTLKLDTLEDLVAAKMNALVERGAPRDFRDIFTLCHAGFVDAAKCWRLWRQRQSLAGGDSSAARGRTAIETHLERIELHRPLERISEPASRLQAEKLRAWFRKEFIDALLD